MENDNITPKSIIKSWFEQGLKPLAAQFHAWMDAYWHKNEKIPLGTVEHLEETLNKKAESSTLEDMSGKFEGHVSDNTLHKTENEQNKLSYLADNPNSTYATKESLNDLADNVYRKSETYNRTEVNERNSVTLQTAMEYADNQVSGLGNQVYRKTETYNRGEVDSKDTATLEAAKKYVVDRIAEIVGSSPDALDTLYEIAAALGNDPDFATTIMTLINNKADKVHTHTRSQITDFPTSLPASDVYAWAKASTKPSYTPSEVGAAATSHKHAATDVTEDSTHRFMTDEERTKLKNLNNSGFEIKEIDNFNDASTSGIYAVRGNALGGPKYNDPSFAYRGCLKVFSQSSGSPSIPSLFTLMEFTVKDNNGNTFYFIRFYGEINNTSEDWVQVVPTSPSTSVPSPSPTD